MTVEKPPTGKGGRGMIPRLEVLETSAHELGEWAAMRAEMMLEIGLIGASEVDSFRTRVTNWLADVGGDNGSQFIGFIGLVAGSPAATSGVTIYTSPPHPRYEGREAYLMSMFVRPAFRRQGIGTAILIATMNAAKIAGAGNVWLLATDAGAPLYRRHGFESRSEYMALAATR